MAEIQKYDHYRIGLNKAIQYFCWSERETEKEVIQYLQKEEISEQATCEVDGDIVIAKS